MLSAHTELLCRPAVATVKRSFLSACPIGHNISLIGVANNEFLYTIDGTSRQLNPVKALCTSVTSLTLNRRAIYRIVGNYFGTPFVLGQLTFEVRRARRITVKVLRQNGTTETFKVRLYHSTVQTSDAFVGCRPAK